MQTMDYRGGSYTGHGVYRGVAIVPDVEPPAQLQVLERPAELVHYAVPQPQQPKESPMQEQETPYEAVHRTMGYRIFMGSIAALLALQPGAEQPHEIVKPDHAAVTMVENLLAQPDAPFTADGEQDTGHKAGDLDAEFARNQLIYARRQVIAKQNGLTVFDGSALIRSLQQMENSMHVLDGHQAYEAVAAFMAQYGITVQLNGGDIALDYNLQGITDQEYLATSAARASLVQLVRDFAAAPKQYIELAGVRRIILAMSNEEGSDRAAYTDPVASQNYIVVNTSKGGQQVIGHELAHRINGHITPGYKNYTANTSFQTAAGNPVYGAPIPAGGNRPDTIPANSAGYISLDQFNYTYKAERAAVLAEAESPACKSTAQNAAAVLIAQAAKVNFNSTYAGVAEPEHQAEIDAPMFNGDSAPQEVAPLSTYDFSTVASPKFPLLRKQFIHEVARLASYGTIGKRIVTYFMGIAYKHRRNDPAAAMTEICK